jgi:DNA (cytosine-5)-methyltransferase 1
MDTKKYKILSLFTGCGGLDTGFHGDFKYLCRYYKSLPFETVFAMDNNEYACSTVEYNHKYFKNTEVICEDITSYPVENIKGRFDLLIGGFPCVTFSVVGKQAGIKDNVNGRLYESFAKYVEYFKPKVFLAENVKGILSANSGEAVKIIKERFEIDGYRVKVFPVNFADFGIPQLRQRVLFIGIRNDIETDFVPPEFISRNNYVSAEEALCGISGSCSNHNLIKCSPRTVKMLEIIPPGSNYKSLIGTEYEVKGLMSNIYRRLKPDEPAYTVIASGGGGTWTYHYSEPRPLTNRERARLQGFPDDFVFCGSNSEVRRQIGNAVPPAGIHPFAERIADVLAGIQNSSLNLNCIKEIAVGKPSYKSFYKISASV